MKPNREVGKKWIVRERKERRLTGTSFFGIHHDIINAT
jgi:hypothetical protein